MSELESFLQWYDAAAALKAAKTLESDLRYQVVKEQLQSAEVPMVESRSKRVVGSMPVTIITKLNKKLDLAVLGAVWTDLTDAEKLCVDMKPNLNAKHKKLPDDSLLWQAIIVTPAMPVIEVKE